MELCIASALRSAEFRCRGGRENMGNLQRFENFEKAPWSSATGKEINQLTRYRLERRTFCMCACLSPSCGFPRVCLGLFTSLRIDSTRLLISSLCPFREQELNAAKCLREPNITIGLSCGVIGKEEVPFGISCVRISPCFLRILEKAADTRILCVLVANH